MQTTTNATETHDVHSAECVAMSEFDTTIPRASKCRCRALAEVKATMARLSSPITFVGPIGKSNPRREEPRRDAWEAVRRIF